MTGIRPAIWSRYLQLFVVTVVLPYAVAPAVHVDVSAPGPAAPGFAGADPDFTGPIRNITVAVGREAVLSCSVTHLGQFKTKIDNAKQTGGKGGKKSKRTPIDDIILEIIGKESPSIIGLSQKDLMIEDENILENITIISNEVGWLKTEDQTILSLHTRVVTHNPRISVTHDNLRTWQLHIRQLKESDRGCYMCQINTSTMKKQVGCIDVQVPPDIDDSETSSDVTVSEGDNATLSCRATGHPQPRILWRREDGEHLVLKKNFHDAAINVDTFSGDTLTLLKVNRKQIGAYLCITSNDVPPAVSKRITLNVKFPPIIKVSNQLVGAPLGTDVQLECYVEAFPNTINYWIKNQREMLLDGKKYVVTEERNGYMVYLVLLVRNISRRDLGTYMCVANNSEGRTDGTIRLYEIKVPTTPPSTMTSMTSLQSTWVTEWMNHESSVESVSSVASVQALREEPPAFVLLTLAPPPQEHMESFSLSSSPAHTPGVAVFLLIIFVPCVR